MRRRAWAAWTCLALGIAAGLLGRMMPPADAWNLAAGILVLAAAVLLLTTLGLARRLMPSLVPHPDLFEQVGPGERWCAVCGHPTATSGPCRKCADPGRPTGGRKATFQAKRRPRL